MLFGVALVALAGLLTVMLCKGGLQSSCRTCAPRRRAKAEPAPETDL